MAIGCGHVVALPNITLPLAEATNVVAPAPKSREKKTGSGDPVAVLRSTDTPTQSPGMAGEPAGHGPISVTTDGAPMGSPQMRCSERTACTAARAASGSAELP